MSDDRPYARELGAFLKARRSRLTPEEAGFAPGPRRRVAGLRREELALLAGLSTDYYQRMEQGREVRPSDDVLDALADALMLDDEERRHFLTLAHAARRPAAVTRPRRGAERVPDSTRRLLHTMGCPGVVLGRHLDVLAWNDLAEALLGDAHAVPPAERNMLLLLFRDPETQARCPDFEATALDYIGMLRKAVGEDPTHPRALAVVGELSIRSAEFRRLWARHDVKESTHGRKAFAHPRVGMIALDWDAYPLPGARGPVLIAYTAEPGTGDAEKLHLLARLHAERRAAPAGMPRPAGAA